jgi:sugar/nucleoside kinase (ribokinase family)
MPSPIEVDATGAGDTMLAGLVAARVSAGSEGRVRGRDVRLGAVAASLLVEGPGMDSVPTFAQIRDRLAAAAQGTTEVDPRAG